MADRYEVVIVGGGPVGLALAVELGQRGISTLLVERHLEPQRIPKGQGLTARTLEHFYFWNCADELRAARLLPVGYPIGSLTAYNDLMGEYWFVAEPPIGRGGGTSFYFQANERLPQYLTEQVLRNRLAGLPNVQMRFGHSAKAFEQDGNGVRITIAGEGWPYEEQVVEADYLVGCDGVRSMVRETLGIDRGGENFDQRMVLAVFRSRELHEGLKRFPEVTTYRVLKPELQGYWQFFGRIDVGEGWFFHAPVPRDTSPDNYDFLSLIQQAAGFKFNAEFDHVGFWDLRIQVATRYQHGRVFIAGDACHSHPPYGGFGLNAGLEDVANLGWKLAAVIQGWGGPGLLASYTEERQPIFAETGEALISGWIEKDKAILDRYRPDRDQAAFEAAWKQLATTASQQSSEPYYEGSSVVLGPPGTACTIHGQHTQAALPGHHLTPQLLSTGKNVYEALGSSFTLIALSAAEQSVRAFEQAAESLHVPLKVIHDSYEGERQAYGTRLILVRPDQYVCWSGNEGPRDPVAVLRNVVGLL
ncbi:FAD-dependent monooxygenase [Candidatus Entotheonella palauensis]|uniref:FAD-dependent monooxygenase n=1 Tax=Candidatus Entotheonella palauensis TaxID=93172 RepID=UPI000B7D9CBE|nr:FAD-dependent monooxygenase [Candidatus Entotheonella palauensis]